MATFVIMPRQGQSVETCIITKWFKQKGDSVSTGDILFSYETDKAAFDFESPADGILLDILFEEGSEVPVLENVAVIGKSGEVITGSAVSSKSDKISDTPVPAKPSQVVISGQTPDPPVQETDQKIKISPRARKMAESRGLSYSSVRGSGPNGRIIAADIQKALVEKGSPDAEVMPGHDFNDQPVTNIRKLIARAMHASLSNSAQLTHHMSADVRKLTEVRKRIKEDLATGKIQQDITLNDMICWCVIRALEKHPEANTHFLDDKIRTFRKVHLAIAVDTPRGLMVPALKNADEMDLATLSKELKSLADSCRSGSINPELIQSSAASFTVSNLGNYGVEMFTPVINLPQTCILGVCSIINRPVSLGNGVFGFVPHIGLSLTYDHRAIDGGPATLFLREIREQIEKFSY